MWSSLLPPAYHRIIMKGLVIGTLGEAADPESWGGSFDAVSVSLFHVLF